MAETILKRWLKNCLSSHAGDFSPEGREGRGAVCGNQHSRIWASTWAWAQPPLGKETWEGFLCWCVCFVCFHFFNVHWKSAFFSPLILFPVQKEKMQTCGCSIWANALLPSIAAAFWLMTCSCLFYALQNRGRIKLFAFILSR